MKSPENLILLLPVAAAAGCLVFALPSFVRGLIKDFRGIESGDNKSQDMSQTPSSSRRSGPLV